VNGPAFLDTNVFVYAWDAADEARQRRARAWIAALWAEGNGRVSFQVLTEFYVTVTQKLDPAVDRATARGYVQTLLQWKPVGTDATLLERAWRAQDQFRLSWWDALILAAAQEAGCTALVTEDLQDGRSYGGVTVVNPFRVAPDEQR
jgi:predicted nucleic acid-binding protein